MLLGGDELGRTQGGNNNAYCQDNQTSWVDWSLAGGPDDLTEFVASLAGLRHRSPVLHRRRFFREGELEWLRPDGAPMSDADWADPGARAVCVTGGDSAIVLLVNGWWEPLAFTVPPVRSARFSVLVDTSSDGGAATVGPGGPVELDGRSLMLLRREGS